MKLQSAIEYLSTYAWALLTLSIVIVVLFTMLGISASPVQECILPAGFSCPNFFLSQNGILTINLLQATQYPIRVTAIGCNYPLSFSGMVPANVISPPSNSIFMSIGSNYTFTGIQCYSNGTAYSGSVRSTFSGYLIINYTNGYTNFPNTLYGSLRVEVIR